ncbi:MAG: hypothetical protein ACFE0I_12410 [Elainellaceae cyanobacterium]
MSYTTEQLIQILDQELRATWRGERILLSSADRIRNPVISKALGSEKLSKVFAYRDFRSQIHDYQLQHRVSGIIWRTCSFRGHEIPSPELHNQLVPVPGDKETLIASKLSIITFWRDVTPGMNLWLVGDEPVQTSVDHVERLISDAEWVEVDAARTELYLSLCWGNPKECHYKWAWPNSYCERIIAADAEPSSIKV